jgi:hypothetical protein
MTRTRIVAVTSVLIGLFFIYLAGIGIRERYGIRIIVRNETGQILREVQLNVEAGGRHYTLGQLPPGSRRSVFVQPLTESRVDLVLVSQDGTNRVATVVGYAEQGYCGNADVAIVGDGRIDSRDGVKAGCWGSWFDFM